MYTLYAPGAHVTSKSLLEAYTLYLRWYDAIPTTLRLGHNFTPAVLFAHMYYHYAILLLFRPFIKLSFTSSGVSPRDVCGQAADAISALVNSYSQLYTLRRTPSFVPYFVLTSCITHLVVLGNSCGGPENLKQGIRDLKEMTNCHGFAIRAMDILRYLIKHWDINVQLDEEFGDRDELGASPELAISPVSKIERATNEKRERDEKERDKDERDCKPKSTSLNQFCPNIASVDVVNGIGPVSDGGNPLFWPFPLQGRPLLDVVSEGLRESGFAVLS